MEKCRKNHHLVGILRQLFDRKNRMLVRITFRMVTALFQTPESYKFRQDGLQRTFFVHFLKSSTYIILTMTDGIFKLPYH